MIEACIICSHPCDIEDIGIFGLVRGEHRWASIQSVQKSRDILEQQAAGNIRVVRRSRKRKPPTGHVAPPFVAASRSRTAGVGRTAYSKTHAPAPPTPRPPPTLSPNPTHSPSTPLPEPGPSLQSVLKELLPQIREVVSDEILRSRTEVDLDGLKALLSEFAASGDSPQPHRHAHTGSSPNPLDSEPIYIPSDFSETEKESHIDMATQESHKGAEALDDAQDLLRKLKKKR